MVILSGFYGSKIFLTPDSCFSAFFTPINDFRREGVKGVNPRVRVKQGVKRVRLGLCGFFIPQIPENHLKHPNWPRSFICMQKFLKSVLLEKNLFENLIEITMVKRVK